MNAKVNLKKMTVPDASSKALCKTSPEFVVFSLGDREYAIHIRHVQRLRGYRSLTRIVNGPDVVEGVAISDGIIMPIVDMRLHCNIAAPSFNHFTVVIILSMLDRTIGLVVDEVLDVISLAAGEVKPLPNLDSPLKAEYLSGIARYEGRDLILLDIEKLMCGSGIRENEKLKA